MFGTFAHTRILAVAGPPRALADVARAINLPHKQNLVELFERAANVSGSEQSK